MLNTTEASNAASEAFSSTLQKFTYNDGPSSTQKRVTRTTSNSTKTPKTSTTSSPSRKRKPSQPPTSPPSTAKKRKRTSQPTSGYAPPTKYAHLTNHLTDSLAPNLICIFIGVNPGIQTATSGHAYAHPSNLFWKLTHTSGCTPRRCKPEEDGNLPHLFALGHTNIVSRPTKDASELSAEEMGAGVAVLEEKVRRWRPESVCLVGKGIWETVWRVRKGKKIGKAEFAYGWQDEGENMGVWGMEGEEDGWKGARVFVATTTSGLAAGMRPWEKEEVWRGLGEWVKRRRRERGICDDGGTLEEPAWKCVERVETADGGEESHVYTKPEKET